ncbi:MAG: hypothetical protein KDC92_14645 [Bacteroidetes bacterium]|nr:hypothetical protein [Bacteroidota bacterium]
MDNGKSILDWIENHEIFVHREDVTDRTVDLVEWKPMPNAGSANFVSAKLNVVSDSKIEIVPSNGMGCFIWLFIGIGIFLLLISLSIVWLFGIDSMKEAWVVPAAGAFFVLFSLLFKKLGTRRSYCDLALGYFWQGKKDLNTLTTGEAKNQVRLSEIAALQMLKKEVLSSKRNYTNIELNLVLKNGKRINLLSHIDGNQIAADAVIIASLLKLQVWFEG